jgi:FdhD protein
MAVAEHLIAPVSASLAEVSVQVSMLSAAPKTQHDTVAAEVPVALVFNGISHAVMMATPQDLEAFALGFALSEGLVDGVGDVYGIDVQAADTASLALPTGWQALEVHLTIATSCFERLKHRRRQLAGRTGCGVCGIDSLAALDLVSERLAPRPWTQHINLATVLRAVDALPALQPLNAQCGALHAAAWATMDGTLLQVMEDVGRHNALDKLLGTLARSALLDQPGFVVMTSRASHELVRKCVRLGITGLATISAPTTLGVQCAEQAGLRLWGLCRSPRAVLYSAGLPSSL